MYNAETQFKALMHAGVYIDANLLGKGLYCCNKPFIYEKGQTIQMLIEQAITIRDMTGASFVSEKYLENLKQCQLVDVAIIQIQPEVNLSLDNSQEG